MPIKRPQSWLSAAWCLALILAGATTRAAELALEAWEGQTMGSIYRVKIAGPSPGPARLAELKTEVDQRLREINRQMSHYDPGSELSRFNRAPANRPFQISPEFARVVRFSLELNRLSQGAFDPTLGPVINLWGFGEQGSRREPPPPVELLAALKKTGCAHLAVTARDELVKDIPELALNLSATAKGFGVDEIVRILRRHGLTNVYASIAGEVQVLGHNPRGTNWQIGISAPVEHWTEADPMIEVVSLSNQAISTSGDYQKFFKDAQGRRWCHLLDPRTGWPVQHQVAGVSLVAPDSLTADGLSTTLFVLGPERGLKFIEAWTNAAALFLMREPEGRSRQIASPRFARLAGIRP